MTRKWEYADLDALPRVTPPDTRIAELPPQVQHRISEMLVTMIADHLREVIRQNTMIRWTVKLKKPEFGARLIVAIIKRQSIERGIWPTDEDPHYSQMVLAITYEFMVEYRGAGTIAGVRV